MIVTELYDGQGLGNQLWCYVVTRVIAAQRGYAFGILHPERFKGADVMTLDFGMPLADADMAKLSQYEERAIKHPKTGADIRTYDADLMHVADNTKIDGYMQDEEYIAEHRDQIREWLAVRPEMDDRSYASDDICVINFRGGEYLGHRDILLPQQYWDTAVAEMRKTNQHFRFVVVTDDPTAARTFFPEFEITHRSIGSDYSIIKNAHYLILANSSFAWFPAWLGPAKRVIAPKYWAHYNTSDGYWGLGYALTHGWEYLDRTGRLFTYDECAIELARYHETFPVPVFAAPPVRDRRMLWLFWRAALRKLKMVCQ
jgi:hypothetical protein